MFRRIRLGGCPVRRYRRGSIRYRVRRRAGIPSPHPSRSASDTGACASGIQRCRLQSRPPREGLVRALSGVSDHRLLPSACVSHVQHRVRRSDRAKGCGPPYRAQPARSAERDRRRDGAGADRGVPGRQCRCRATRAIVFRGAGRAFCAGADLKTRKIAGSEAAARARAHAIQDVTRAIVLATRRWSARSTAGRSAAASNGRSIATSRSGPRARGASSRKCPGACSSPAACRPSCRT